MIPQVLPTRYLLNPRAVPGRPYGTRERSVLDAEGNARAFREISSWTGYRATPLLSLPNLARRLGLGAILYKDEGDRLGLGSFKALGGAYGVFRVLQKVLAEDAQGDVTSRDFLAGRHAERIGRATVTCASLGNHGRAVAWGARLFGCRSVVFLPEHTSEDRVAAIRELGARIVGVRGSYDDAVAEAARRGREDGWFVVSDTAYAGYEEIPRFIMQGYTVLAREALAQMPQIQGLQHHSGPTHVFVQAGVGGLAAAVTAYLWEEMGPAKPRITVVEPADADGLFESALFGRLTPSRGALTTSMSCLACRDPSTVAWRILEDGADAFVTLPDHAAEDTVGHLARGWRGDPPILSQPSGAAGLAGLLATAFEPSLSGPLDLGERSVVLVIGSEGHPGRGTQT